MIIIRQEEQKDFEAVFNLVEKSFAQAEHSDGNEQFLLARLRASDVFIPQLSLVAEEDGEIVGQIMFTKMKVGDTTQLTLAPIAVDVTKQGLGIGKKLIEEGHKIAQNLGYEFAILIGYPDYYSRFGYVDAAQFGIATDLELPENVFMACNLQQKSTYLNAKAEFAKEFFEN